MIKTQENRTVGQLPLTSAKTQSPIEVSPSEAQNPDFNIPLATEPKHEHRVLLAMLQTGGRTRTTSPTPTQKRTFQDYENRTFIDLPQSSEIKVSKVAKTTLQTKSELNVVARADDDGGKYTVDKVCDPKVIKDIKEHGRLNDSGSFYPYVTAQGHHEGLGRPAILSINGATVTLVPFTKLPIGVNAPISRSHRLAEDIEKLETKYDKTLLGFRPISLKEGWFAIYFEDNVTHQIKMGQFALKNMPTSDGQQLWKDLKKPIHEDMTKIVEHFFK